MKKQTKAKDYLFDDLTMDIVRELRRDSRLSYRKLAKRLGVSTITVIDRVKKLEKSGAIIRYTISIDPTKLGYEYMGVIMVTISEGALIETQRKISSFSGVIGIYDVTGQHDACVFAMCANRADFSKLIKKIRNIKTVDKTTTNIVLNVIKDPLKTIM